MMGMYLLYCLVFSYICCVINGKVIVMVFGGFDVEWIVIVFDFFVWKCVFNLIKIVECIVC